MTHLRLPVPPSANRYWRSWRHRMVRSPDATNYIAAVRVLAAPLRRRFGWPLLGPVAITVLWYRAKAAGNLDNRLKVLIDSLQGIAYQDDEQIVSIEALRLDTDKANPRMEVRVVPFVEGPCG